MGCGAPLAIVLRANPVVEWYLRHKCPQIIPWLVFMPGNNDVDNDQHAFLLAHGFHWARFPEPPDFVRKYWKTLV